MRVADLLAELGADLRIVDPLVSDGARCAGLRVELNEDEVSAADLVVVLTDHDEFDWDLVLARSAQIFDTRNRLRGDNVQRL